MQAPYQQARLPSLSLARRFAFRKNVLNHTENLLFTLVLLQQHITKQKDQLKSVFLLGLYPLRNNVEYYCHFWLAETKQQLLTVTLSF